MKYVEEEIRSQINNPFEPPPKMQTEQTNVLGGPLEGCSFDPMTGYYRDGHCRTGPGDRGLHTVCAMMTDAFLRFSASRGNDLITPMPEYDFPGLVAGDAWCLCMGRWLEALEAGCAPKIKLEACHISVLEFVDLDTLKSYAV